MTVDNEESRRSVSENFDEQASILLDLPAQPRLFLIARMTASAVAATCDFGVDDVEDLRLAIDELCSLCIGGSSEESRMTLVYRPIETGMIVSCRVSAVSTIGSEEDAGADDDRQQLSKLILGSLVNEYGINAVESGVCAGWLRKERSSAARP